MATAIEEIVMPARQSSAPRVWAGAVIVLAGLALIVLGGCFLIGVLEASRSNVTVGPGTDRLVGTLYAIAYLCFGGAVLLLVIGVWGLYRVLWGPEAT